MQNFGKIKNSLNNFLAEGVVVKDEAKRQLFKKYIKTIKESEILRTQFLVFNNIENKVEKDYHLASSYVTENIKLLEKYNRSKILKENKKLLRLLGSEKIESEYVLSNLHESITNLIFKTRTAKNIDEIVNDTFSVTNHVFLNTPKELTEGVDLPLSMLTNILVGKYNEKYNGLTNEEKNVLRVVMSDKIDEKKELYNNTLIECTNLVDSLLINADQESKDKLFKVKNKLSEDININESELTSKIFKLIELKQNLKD